MINTISCTPGKLQGLLEALYKLKMSAMIWGEPGIGKSESVQQFAASREMELVDIRLTQLDSPDLQGLKWVDEAAGVTRSYRPEFFPTVDKPGVIFLDEITAAEPRMQATSYQLVLDRRVGPHVLPSKWMVVAAGNRPEDGAISFKMGSALSDRFVHILVEANSNDWVAWAAENKIHPAVISFIRVKPSYLSGVEGQAKTSQLISPSPRSWHRVSEVMNRIVGKEEQSVLVNGIVGEAAAVQFFLTADEIGELPAMADLLMHKDPKIAVKHVPMKIACLYGLAYSLAAHVSNAMEIDRSMAIFDCIQKKRDSNLPTAEIETLANEMLLAKAGKLGVLPEVVRGEAYKTYSPRAQQITRS